MLAGHVSSPEAHILHQNITQARGQPQRHGWGARRPVSVGSAGVLSHPSSREAEDSHGTVQEPVSACQSREALLAIVFTAMYCWNKTVPDVARWCQSVQGAKLGVATVSTALELHDIP